MSGVEGRTLAAIHEAARRQREAEAWATLEGDQDARLELDRQRAMALSALTDGIAPISNVAAVARRLRVTRETVYRWRDDY